MPERSLNEFFIEIVLQIMALFDQFSDGQYYLNLRHFVINERGKIKHYKFDALSPKIPKAVRTSLVKMK